MKPESRAKVDAIVNRLILRVDELLRVETCTTYEQDGKLMFSMAGIFHKLEEEILLPAIKDKPQEKNLIELAGKEFMEIWEDMLKHIVEEG